MVKVRKYVSYGHGLGAMTSEGWRLKMAVSTCCTSQRDKQRMALQAFLNRKDVFAIRLNDRLALPVGAAPTADLTC